MEMTADFHPFNNAQYAKRKVPVGARYFVTSPGMEDGWVAFGPHTGARWFSTEEEAKHFAAEKGIPQSVYPSFGGRVSPFGRVLLCSDFDVKNLSIDEFNAEWEDYIPTKEELEEMAALALARRPVSSAEGPDQRYHNGPPDTFVEHIDPLAPAGPGNGPNTGPDPAVD